MLRTLHLCFEVVKCAEQYGFGRHGELGGAELVFAVVREDHVLDENAELVGEWGEGLDFFAEHALGDADVADHLAFEGVAEAGLPAELADFADVVQDGSGDEEVGVDLGVEGGGGPADADEG